VKLKLNNKIQLVNWILTRKCNLECDYCGIVRNSNETIYPNINYYNSFQMNYNYVIESLEQFKQYLPDCFHIFYGGEPFMFPHLDKVIQYCNDNNIWYTIITNNSKKIQPKIIKVLDKVGLFRGLTASIDPIIYDPIFHPSKKDRREKSLAGLENLISISDRVDDMMAEITIDKSNLEYIYQLVEKLTKHKIWSSITFVDIKKSRYYDFSNVTDINELVDDTQALRSVCAKMIDDGLWIHMGEELLDRTLNILPSTFNCELENYMHNLTIDADGSIRLCLRIKGKYTSDYYVKDFFNDFENIHNAMIVDKKEYCKLCNWTCPIMSKLAVEEDMTKDILHI